MIINPKIQKIFKEYNINYDEGILYLLAIHFNLKIPEEMIEETIKQVNFSKIVERDYSTNSIKWNTPLFFTKNEDEKNNKDENWIWVTDEFRTIFTDVRIDAGGDKNACLIRMKKLFMHNPHVRKEDVIEATKMYVYSVKDPQYLQRADYFIEKGKGTDRISRLEEFLEIVKAREKQIVTINPKMR